MSSIALYTTRLAFVVFLWILIFVGGSDGKVSACDEGDLGFIPESRRSPGEGNGNPLQYYCLENSMNGGAWWATVHGVAKSWTRLRDFTSLYLLCPFFFWGNQIFQVSFFYFIFKLYIIVLVLPNIRMNPPQVYICSPS